MFQAGGGVGLAGRLPIQKESERHPTSGGGKISRRRTRVRPEVGEEVPEKDSPPRGAAQAHLMADLAKMFKHLFRFSLRLLVEVKNLVYYRLAVRNFRIIVCPSLGTCNVGPYYRKSVTCKNIATPYTVNNLLEQCSLVMFAVSPLLFKAVNSSKCPDLANLINMSLPRRDNNKGLRNDLKSYRNSLILLVLGITFFVKNTPVL